MIDLVPTPQLTEDGKGRECHVNYTVRSKIGK